MKDIDYLALDGRSLALFLAVFETGSVTEAAGRLDLTQSAVSHGLQKLRAVVGDPLFVKSGRGIVATAHAHQLAGQARALIQSLEAFARPPVFERRGARLAFTIAANDFQADLLLPAVFRRLGAEAGHVSLRIIPSGAPTPDLLRERRCDLVITPLPPEGSDILRRRVFQDRYLCFFDAACRRAPADLSEYLSAQHVTVVHADQDRLEFDRTLEARGVARDIVLRVQGFAGVPSFLSGTRMLASLPGLLRHTLMRGFDHAPVPLVADAAGDARLLPMFMAWHRRDQLDPAHVWLRETVAEVAREMRGQRAQT